MVGSGAVASLQEQEGGMLRTRTIFARYSSIATLLMACLMLLVVVGVALWHLVT